MCTGYRANDGHKTSSRGSFGQVARHEIMQSQSPPYMIELFAAEAHPHIPTAELLNPNFHI